MWIQIFVLYTPAPRHTLPRGLLALVIPNLVYGILWLIEEQIESIFETALLCDEARVFSCTVTEFSGFVRHISGSFTSLLALKHFPSPQYCKPFYHVTVIFPEKFYLQWRGHIIEIRKLIIGLERKLFWVQGLALRHENRWDANTHRKAECGYEDLLPLHWGAKIGQSPPLTGSRQCVSSWLGERLR